MIRPSDSKWRPGTANTTHFTWLIRHGPLREAPTGAANAFEIPRTISSVMRVRARFHCFQTSARRFGRNPILDSERSSPTNYSCLWLPFASV